MKFELKPHVGIGLIELGMSRNRVKTILGNERFDSTHGKSDYYYSASLQIEFTAGIATFIGLSHSNYFSVFYKDRNVFDITSNNLFEYISSFEKENHTYDSCEYLFPTQIITLWDADTQYDYFGNEQREVWAQIGIGSIEYLKAVS